MIGTENVTFAFESRVMSQDNTIGVLVLVLAREAKFTRVTTC